VLVRLSYCGDRVRRACFDDVSSVPLSLRWSLATSSRSNSRATRVPEIDVSGTNAKHSRVQSSTTTRTRMRRPSMN
jgi:hypothetical protein